MSARAPRLRQPIRLAAEDDRDGPGQVGIDVERRRVDARRHDPDAGRAEPGDDLAAAGGGDAAR